MSITNNDPIKHVVLLMMENRSFDHMLGCFKDIYPDLEGVDKNNLKANHDLSGNPVQQAVTTNMQMDPDPKHELVNVLEQIKDHNSGFVLDFEKKYPKAKEQQKVVMGYYDLDFLPATHTLARDFLICDRWFASIPGPTWPNRFFALTGTCMGQAEMPAGINSINPKWYTEQNQTTLFDRLNEVNKNWKVFYYDIPCSLLLSNQRKVHNLTNYHKIEKFFNEEVKNESAFPDFVFIEPKYFGQNQNDNHPPHNLMKAEKLVADVYNAIRSNADLWNSTLLVVVYDEHGGFYDHVEPPTAISPDDHKYVNQKDNVEFCFDRLGVRVPAILISPWVKKGFTSKTFDHTSFLKYLTDKWNLGPLGNRTANANSLASEINLSSSDQYPRTDTTAFIRVANSLLISENIDIEKTSKNKNQSGLHHFADFLHDEMDKAAQEGIAVAKAEIVKIAGTWIKLKKSFGETMMRLGQSLTGDFHSMLKSRENRTSQTVDRLKELLSKK